MRRLSFRQKIIISQIALFIALIALTLPFVQRSVTQILISSLQQNSNELIDTIDTASSEQEMMHALQKSAGTYFYDVTLFNPQRELIYDFYTELFEGKRQGPSFGETLPKEVENAFNGVSSYLITESAIFHRMFVFLATPFQFQGATYVLVCAFPYHPIQRFGIQFDEWLLGLSSIIVIAFSILTWFIFNRLQRPIDLIIRAIRTYQGGQPEKMPQMLQDKSILHDADFHHLAETLNSLYEQVKRNLQNVIAEKNEKEAILESLLEGVVAVDEKMNVRYVNFIGSRMLGQSRRQLLSRPFPDEGGGPYSLVRKKGKELLEACQRHNNVLTDSIAVDTGKKVYLDLVAAPKGGGLGAIIVLQDKSSQHKVIEMGKDFVANASHELRTPITIIRGFAETLQDLQDIPKEMLNDIVEKIVRNCQRMDTLVKNLLTLADVDNIPISNYQKCDLSDLLEHCREVVLAVYQDASIVFHRPKEPIYVLVDPNILELAITNLLDNAAKYSKPPADITILLEEKESEVEITIQDKGIGIPSQDIEHIFERFYTVDKAHSRRLGGAGLGLSLVKTIIDKHDGTIQVRSTLGVGTAFIIHLPLDKEV